MLFDVNRAPLDTLILLGIVLILGILSSTFLRRVKVPKVVGFILVGILLGPSVLNIVHQEFLEASRSIIDVALAFIAFLIGGSLRWSRIRNLGKTIFSVAFFEAEGTFLFTSAVLYFTFPLLLENPTTLANWQFYLVLSLVLGAIATATAPAAVLATIHEVRARGSLTTTVLAVVAVDDSLALFNFIFVISLSGVILGYEHVGMAEALIAGSLDIFGAVAFGAVAAVVLMLIETRLPRRSSKSILTLGVLILVFGMAREAGQDGLLAVMMMGIVFANFCESFDEVYEEFSEHLEEIIFTFFFVLSGAHLDFHILAVVPLLTVIYVTARVSGKMAGAYVGAVLSSEEPKIRHYTGLALLPQAGVAIGLALSFSSGPHVEVLGHIVLNVIIAAVTVNELLGPVILKYALRKAGEIKEENI